jgi:hypothetical protein
MAWLEGFRKKYLPSGVAFWLAVVIERLVPPRRELALADRQTRQTDTNLCCPSPL